MACLATGEMKVTLLCHRPSLASYFRLFIVGTGLPQPVETRNIVLTSPTLYLLSLSAGLQTQRFFKRN